MGPAHQQLAAHHGARGVHLALHKRGQLPFGLGLFQVLLQRQALLHVGLHGGFVEADAVAAQVLGAVHGGVGLAQQVFHAIAALGEQRDANAARGAVEVGGNGVGRLQHRADLLSHQQGRAPGRFHVGGHVVHQHHKLVAAQPGHGVARAQLLRKALCHLHQQRIAHGVAARVVDLLEIVEINVEHRPHLGGVEGTVQGMLHAVKQHAPVGQAGEAVEVRQLVRACLGLFALGDVARQGDEPGLVAGRGGVLAGDGQLEPVGGAAQLQPVLVARRVPRVVRSLQRGMAARCGFGWNHFAHQTPQKHLGRHGQQVRPRRAVVVDAAVQPQLEQQVGNGVECALQVIARGAQLGGHAMRQRHGALASGGQEPGEPGQQQAEQAPHQGDSVVPRVLEAQQKGGVR